MTSEKDPASAAAAYDAMAEEYDWRGPEVAFGLSYGFVQPRQTILDIGIGTGLGSILFHKAGLEVHGMDRSSEMLAACRSKKFAADLRRHDLADRPYPYDSAGMDHAISVGVFHFCADLSVVFGEVARIVRDDGVFAFIVEDREPGEESEYVMVPDDTPSASPVTMYRHGREVIDGLLDDNHFELLSFLEFPVPMDRRRTRMFGAKAYVVRREPRA